MKPPKTAGRDEHAPEKPPRKAYQKPRLERYGDLTEIAKTIAAGTQNDGAGHPNKHFTN